jgi:hypothetical protein
MPPIVLHSAWKALVALFKEEFAARHEGILQHIALLTQCCRETKVIQDFIFIVKENNSPYHIVMSKTFKNNSILIDPS